MKWQRASSQQGGRARMQRGRDRSVGMHRGAASHAPCLCYASSIEAFTWSAPTWQSK